uniref:Saposin B-type domain-containing protein n=1 Tax=Strongyloides venezuelensis TaxID=75913 RepID=A0A0K0FI44_STRVS
MKYFIIYLFTFNFLFVFGKSNKCDSCISSFDSIKKANQAGEINADQLKKLCGNITEGLFLFDNICENIMVKYLDIITKGIKELKDSKDICRTITLCD